MECSTRALGELMQMRPPCVRELLQLGTLLREYGGPVVERETELIETARAAAAAFNRAVAAGAGEREVREAYLELVAADIRLHTITRIASGRESSADMRKRAHTSAASEK